MSEYSDEGFDMDDVDQKPVKQGSSKNQASQQKNEKNVRFKLGGSINTFDEANKDLKGLGTKPKDKVVK